jgi:hypothetical protein
MKQILTFLFLSFSHIFFSQIQKEVDNGIFVTFPSTPVYSTTQNISTFSAKTTNSFFMVIIQRNAVPDYANYHKAEKTWTESERKKVADAGLDSFVKEKLAYTGNTGNVSEVKYGKFYGRKLSYSAVNPATGERGDRYSIVLLVRDKVISFECWYLLNNNSAKTEKDQFFDSIKVN